MRVSLAEVEPAERTSLCGSNLTLFPLNSPMKSASACTCWRSKVSIDMRKRKRCQRSFKRSTTYFLESRQAMIVLEKSQFPEDESAVSPEPHGVGVALQPRLDEIERELHRTIALAGGYTGREKKTKQEEVSSMTALQLLGHQCMACSTHPQHRQQQVKPDQAGPLASGCSSPLAPHRASIWVAGIDVGAHGFAEKKLAGAGTPWLGDP
ncbi:hypothetical protein BHM03_00014854 [Ensete ventricosum]|nr:hypothetical protein BHM03_00014854 [Ensete ventricosum]